MVVKIPKNERFRASMDNTPRGVCNTKENQVRDSLKGSGFIILKFKFLWMN
jgi:hypothetical protein